MLWKFNLTAKIYVYGLQPLIKIDFLCAMPFSLLFGFCQLYNYIFFSAGEGSLCIIWRTLYIHSSLVILISVDSSKFNLLCRFHRA